MNNRRGVVFVIVGLVAAIAAAVAVYLLATNIGNSVAQNAAATPTPVSGKSVIVAARDLEPNTVITTSLLLTLTYPSDLIPPDAYTNTVGLVGISTKQRIAGGLPLLKRQFAAGQEVISSDVIPKGKVLVAFPANDILNSTGAVHPGDHVDILLSLPISGTNRLDASAGAGSQLENAAIRTLVAQATLQDVVVAGTGQFSPAASGRAAQQQQGAARTLTFMVDHQEALILKFIKDSGGSIDLVVRSAEEQQAVTTDPVNIDYLVDLYRFIGLPQR